MVSKNSVVAVTMMITMLLLIILIFGDLPAAMAARPSPAARLSTGKLVDSDGPLGGNHQRR
ncbi:hypothetical protein LINGRAHAP2_LOCUS22009 [Linum grandiflorum]